MAKGDLLHWGQTHPGWGLQSSPGARLLWLWGPSHDGRKCLAWSLPDLSEIVGAGGHTCRMHEMAWGELAGSGSSSSRWYCCPKQQTLAVCTLLLLTFSNNQALKEVWSPELTQPSQHLGQPGHIYLSLLIRRFGDSDTVLSWVEMQKQKSCCLNAFQKPREIFPSGRSGKSMLSFLQRAEVCTLSRETALLVPCQHTLLEVISFPEKNKISCPRTPLTKSLMLSGFAKRQSRHSFLPSWARKQNTAEEEENGSEGSKGWSWTEACEYFVF